MADKALLARISWRKEVFSIKLILCHFIGKVLFLVPKIRNTYFSEKVNIYFNYSLELCENKVMGFCCNILIVESSVQILG